MNTNHKFNILRSVSLLMIGLISVVEATVPPIPKGIFSMDASEPRGFPDLILNDPRIVGSISATSGLILKKQKACMIGRL